MGKVPRVAGLPARSSPDRPPNCDGGAVGRKCVGRNGSGCKVGDEEEEEEGPGCEARTEGALGGGLALSRRGYIEPRAVRTCSHSGRCAELWRRREVKVAGRAGEGGVEELQWRSKQPPLGPVRYSS